MSQTFTYSGYIKNADGSGAVNVPVKVYKRTTPTLTGFTSQTNYNNHSYYRSTGTATWTSAKAACEAIDVPGLPPLTGGWVSPARLDLAAAMDLELLI